ncbi:UNVERIFIED_CONTAM: hypothetical protein HHA_253370 [Hammondia hammondi]|eukprot:XP_008884957.1 hypothetical protein HHA_253370 [Hammondia hammondi]
MDQGRRNLLTPAFRRIGAAIACAAAALLPPGDATTVTMPARVKAPPVPKSYVAAPQVIPSGFEVMEEVPIVEKGGKLQFAFRDGVLSVPAGTLLFECDPTSREDATMRKLVAYIPTDTDTPPFIPVLDQGGGSPIACGADIGRRCFAVEGKGLLRPLKDRERVSVGSSTAVYELLPGNRGRFAAPSLSSLESQKSGTFVLDQLLGLSLGACETPSPNLFGGFPKLTGVEQVDPFSHFIFPVSSPRPASHLPPPYVKPGDELEVCSVPRPDLVHAAENTIFVVRPREENRQEGVSFPVLGGPIVCVKSETGESLGHLDQNVYAVAHEKTATANLISPLTPVGMSHRLTCDLGPNAHTVETLLRSVSTDKTKPLTPGPNGEFPKAKVHHFSAPFVPSVNAPVLVEVDNPVSWEPQSLKKKCKIGASLAALQPHLLLKSEVPHGTPVECEVVHLPAFQTQGQLLMIAPGRGTGARPLLLPPGSILLNQEEDLPPGLFQVLVYDLWEADGLRAVLKQLYYRGADQQSSIPVYVQMEGSRMTAVGSFHRVKQLFTVFSGIDPTARDKHIEASAPFYYTSHYGLPVDVGFVNMKSGVGFSVKRTPEALLLLEDLLKAPLTPASQKALAELSPFTREAENIFSRLHRLKGHFTRPKYAAHAPVVLPLLNAGLTALLDRHKEADTMFLSVYPRSRRTRVTDLQIRLNYLDKSRTGMTVIIRMPMRLKAFISATHLAPQVQRNLSLLLEVIEDPQGPLEAVLLGGDKFGLYSEAVRVALRLLRSGHCRPCADEQVLQASPSPEVAEGRCGLCSARRIDDMVVLDLHDIQPSVTTMPTPGTWMKWNDDTFLISLPPDSNNPIYRRYGVEFDMHTAVDLPPRLSSRFKLYAGACMRSHLIRQLQPSFENPGLIKNCPALSKFAKMLLWGLPFSDAAPILESSKLLLQHVVGACNIPEASWAIDRCLDNDGDLLGYRRMPAVRPLGRTRLANIMREMMSPISSWDFLTSLAMGEERIKSLPSCRLTSAALKLSRDARAVLDGSGDNPPPLPSYVFGPRSPLVDVSAAADDLTGRRAILLISSFTEIPIKVLEELLGINPRSSVQRNAPVSFDSHFQAPILSSVDRTTFDRQPRQSVQDYISSCFTNHPETCAGAYRTLGWPLSKVPEDDVELQAFDRAFNEMRVRLDREPMPEALRSDFQQALAEFDALPPEPVALTPEVATREPEGTPADREGTLGETEGTFGEREGAGAAADGVESELRSREDPDEFPKKETEDLQRGPGLKADEDEQTAASTPASSASGKDSFTVFELPTVDSVPSSGSQRVTLWGQGQMPNALLGASQRAVSTSRRLAWPYINKVLTAKSGPMTRMPSWVRTSDTCPCLDPEISEGCRMDSVKSTTDVVFRLSLLIPPAIEKFMSSQSSTRQLEPPFAAFCASVGIFVSSWQQQLVAGGHEEKGGNMAHSTLVERLAHGHKYLLKTYSENGASDHAHWRQRRRRFMAFQKQYLYRQCRALMVAAGNVVYAPFKAKRFPAVSLYGGIANTLDTPFTDKTIALQGLSVWSEEILRRHRNVFRRIGRTLLRRPPQAPQIGALFAALHMSHIFKDCFNMAGGILLRTWYYMHVQGSTLLAEATRLPKIGAHLAAVGFGFAGGIDVRDSLFAPAFRELSKVVTPVWESDNLFTSLAAYTPGGAVPASGNASTKARSKGAARVEGPKEKRQAASRDAASGENLLDPEKIIGEGGSMPVPASLRRGSPDVSSFLSFDENVEADDAVASEPAEGGRFIASLRYNPPHFADPDRELMIVEVPVPVSAVERRSLASFTSDDVLRFIQQKLVSLHSQLRARGRRADNGSLSMVQLQEGTRRGTGEAASVGATDSDSKKQCHEHMVESGIVGFLADQLDKDLSRKNGAPASYLEIGRLSLPAFSAGNVISRAMQNTSTDTVVVVQMPEVGGDSHLDLESSSLDFSRPITIGGL